MRAEAEVEMGGTSEVGATTSASRPRFIIVGGGMSGILAAVKLRELGHDFTLYEKAENLGGTWRENTYPGIACDVPSHLYSYSFAPNPEWSHRFSPGREIRAYFEQVARAREIDAHVRFGEEVVACERVDGRWQIRTTSGHRDSADFVLLATGVLHHPNYPAIEGLDGFAGAAFHSARWDHTVAVDGRRIGVVGTGSTAVQIVSALCERVSKLSLFQRTAQWIMPQENLAFTAAEIETFRSNPHAIARLRSELSRLFVEAFSNAVVDVDSQQMQTIEALCLANLEQNVHDPVLREKLRPTYRAACKRLVVSGDFYRAIQHQNAELVTDPIGCVEPRGVRTRDGRLHELDVLVLATGFHVDRFMRPMNVVGRGGTKLDDVWASRPSAYLSVSVPEFPNLFMLNGPNGPVGNFSLIDCAEMQFSYIMQLVARVLSGECREISASASATSVYEAERIQAAKKTVWTTGCRSWYLDESGVPAAWPWTYERFRQEMLAPKLAAYEMIR
jgi:cation diffusion facilitator CzcD-associated flavoprotein CzcO